MTRRDFIKAAALAPVLSRPARAADTITRTVAVGGGYQHTSLADAVAWFQSNSANLVSANVVGRIECYGGTATDNTRVTISGITTDATHYLEIAGMRNHYGNWTDAAYSLSNPDGTDFAVNVSTNNVRFTGVQLSTPPIGTNDKGFMNVTGSNVTIQRCILRGTLGSTNGFSMATTVQWLRKYGAGDLNVINTLFYGQMVYAGNPFCASVYCYGPSGTVRVYNCTFWDVFRAVWTDGGGVAVSMKNCGIALNDHSSYNYATYSDIPMTTSSTATPTVVDATNKDFHLALADTAWRGGGTDLTADSGFPFTDDIDGGTRTGLWDIGADQYGAAPAPPVRRRAVVIG